MPRDPTKTLLYSLVAEQRATFSKVTSNEGGAPSFIDEAFARFLRCGVLAHGFARFKCDGCTHEQLVALSTRRDCRDHREPKGALVCVEIPA